MQRTDQGSFGTVVDGGENIIALFDYLAESKTPFIYAYGYQKELLPGHIVEILDEAEKDGRGLAPNWVDQLGVLAHPVSQTLPVQSIRL